jgi:hypothetical protein
LSRENGKLRIGFYWPPVFCWNWPVINGIETFALFLIIFLIKKEAVK